MSDITAFEALAASESENKIAKQAATDKLAAAIYDVREQYGAHLLCAKTKEEFHDRLALCKDDMMKTVNQHLMPVTGVMRKVCKTMEREWQGKIAGSTKACSDPRHTRYSDDVGCLDCYAEDNGERRQTASKPRDRAGDAWRDGRDRGIAEHGRQDADYRDPEYLESQIGEPTGETYPRFDRDGNELGSGTVHRRADNSRRQAAGGRCEHTVGDEQCIRPVEHDGQHLTDTQVSVKPKKKAFQSTILADNTGPVQSIDQTFSPSDADLVPEGDFHGYLDSVDQNAPSQVQRDFEARRRTANYWVQIGGTNTLVAGPFDSEEQAHQEIADKAIHKDGYEVVHGTEGKNILPKKANRRMAGDDKGEEKKPHKKWDELSPEQQNNLAPAYPADWGRNDPHRHGSRRMAKSFTLDPNHPDWIGNHTDDELADNERFWTGPDGAEIGGAQQAAVLKHLKQERDRRSKSARRRVAIDGTGGSAPQALPPAGGGGGDVTGAGTGGNVDMMPQGFNTPDATGGINGATPTNMTAPSYVNATAAITKRYAQWCVDNLARPSVKTLEYYAANRPDREYFVLTSALQRHAAKPEPQHPGKDASPEDLDTFYREMDTHYNTDPRSPLHHDNRLGTRTAGSKDYLQQADEAITKLLNEKAEEFQEGIQPLQQALQTIQYAQQVQQSQNPMGVMPPAGTVNVLPQGGQDPSQQQAPPQDMDPAALAGLLGAGAGGGDPTQQPQGGDDGPPPAAADQGAVPPDMQQQIQARRRQAAETREVNYPSGARGREWDCDCGATVSTSGGRDTTCRKCGQEYNGFGQRLRSDWRDNASNYDEDTGDMEGYEGSFHDARRRQAGHMSEDGQSYSFADPDMDLSRFDPSPGHKTKIRLVNYDDPAGNDTISLPELLELQRRQREAHRRQAAGYGDEDKYNGWTNHPTWNAALWLGNDEGHYRNGLLPALQSSNPAAALKQYVLDSSGGGGFGDLKRGDLGKINWQEIVDNNSDDQPNQREGRRRHAGDESQVGRHWEDLTCDGCGAAGDGPYGINHYSVGDKHFGTFCDNCSQDGTMQKAYRATGKGKKASRRRVAGGISDAPTHKLIQDYEQSNRDMNESGPSWNDFGGEIWSDGQGQVLDELHRRAGEGDPEAKSYLRDEYSEKQSSRRTAGSEGYYEDLSDSDLLHEHRKASPADRADIAKELWDRADSDSETYGDSDLGATLEDYGIKRASRGGYPKG